MNVQKLPQTWKNVGNVIYNISCNSFFVSFITANNIENSNHYRTKEQNTYC